VDEGGSSGVDGYNIRTMLIGHGFEVIIAPVSFSEPCPGHAQ